MPESLHVEGKYKVRDKNHVQHDERESDHHSLPILVKSYASRKRNATRSSGVIFHSQNNTRQEEMRPQRIKNKRKPIGKLSLLDEQMLILCHSAIKRREKSSSSFIQKPYGVESIYAATQIQRIYRGFKTRQTLSAWNGPRYQHAATIIQFSVRRWLVSLRIQRRVRWSRHQRAVSIQAWYRGCRCRDQLLYDRARWLNHAMAMFQRVFRMHRFWNMVSATLAQRRNNAAIVIQRKYRGFLACQRVRSIKNEQRRVVQELAVMAEVHRQQSRCERCQLDTCTEDSLFTCFMSRYLGLHDFEGAKVLVNDGILRYPNSARFYYIYSVLLQVMGEELEVAMTFLNKATRVLLITKEALADCETKYFVAALHLHNRDVATLLDYAVFSQCNGKLKRAEMYYALSLEHQPLDYNVPGYLHRVDMMDRVLLNYHRFTSIFNTKPIRLVTKTVSTTKRSNKAQLVVFKFNHYTVIAPADEGIKCPFNALYLSDEEVFRLINEYEILAVEGENDASDRYVDLMEWQQTKGEESSRDFSAYKNCLVQIYQRTFQGLRAQPKKLAGFSTSQSTLNVSRDIVLRILKNLLFVASPLEKDEKGSDIKVDFSSNDHLQCVLLLPSVVKSRQQRRLEVIQSHSIIHIQRLFRAFQVRARIRREKLLHSIHQEHVDRLYARLNANYMERERRRRGVTEIQRLYKGYKQRKLFVLWQRAAVVIQRYFRGYRGRKRAAAFRDGNLTLYMAERVYHRGLEISGHRVILIIDRCGLSFRMEAVDMNDCSVYPGFFSRQSAMGLICYSNWAYANRLCGYQLIYHGRQGHIDSVESINPVNGECIMNCSFQSQHEPEIDQIPLTDCIQCINLRNISTKGREAEILLVPIREDDTPRVVEIIVERLVLIPSITIPTMELKKKIPNGLLLTVMPPPKAHYKFHNNNSVSLLYTKTPQVQNVPKCEFLAAATLQQLIHMRFPHTDGLRGASIGKVHFRKKCTRHGREFTRCRCVLPLVSTSAHVEAIALALRPPSPPSWRQNRKSS